MSSKAKLPFQFYDVQPVEDYVPRELIMSALEDYMQPSSSRSQRRRTSILQGPGGIGKTQLCLEYFRKYRDMYSACVWFNGSSVTKINKSLRDFCTRLYLEKGHSTDPKHLSDDEVKQISLSWFTSEHNRTWLLVIDNVDLDPDTAVSDYDAYDIQDYIPRTDWGSVLITTRLGALSDLGRSFLLTELDEEQSKRLLEARIGQVIAGTHILMADQSLG